MKHAPHRSANDSTPRSWGKVSPGPRDQVWATDDAAHSRESEAFETFRNRQPNAGERVHRRASTPSGSSNARRMVAIVRVLAY
jgi:hypothetical protein